MKLSRYQIFAGIVLIVVSAALKAITFPYSITPIIAISFFSGVSFKNRQWAFSMPLFAMFLSDCLMEIFRDGQGFYGMGQIGNYVSLLAVTFIATFFNGKKTWQILAGAPLASLIFFFLSNTNCFLFDTSGFYGTGINGWMNCLIAGIPFLEKGILTDLSYVLILLTANHYLAPYFIRKQAIAK